MSESTTWRSTLILIRRREVRSAPAIVSAGIKVLDMISSTTELRDKLEKNTIYFRQKMSKAGFDILEAGGTAVEAMVAAAAQIAVVYPHMNSIGGDGFWLIKKKDQSPVAISACGPAAENATPKWYEKKGYKSFLPTRGPLAALTVPGLSLIHISEPTRPY